VRTSILFENKVLVLNSIQARITGLLLNYPLLPASSNKKDVGSHDITWGLIITAQPKAKLEKD